MTEAGNFTTKRDTIINKSQLIINIIKVIIWGLMSATSYNQHHMTLPNCNSYNKLWIHATHITILKKCNKVGLHCTTQLASYKRLSTHYIKQ